jgi:hypothetical protein
VEQSDPQAAIGRGTSAVLKHSSHGARAGAGRARGAAGQRRVTSTGRRGGCSSRTYRARARRTSALAKLIYERRLALINAAEDSATSSPTGPRSPRSTENDGAGSRRSAFGGVVACAGGARPRTLSLLEHAGAAGRRCTGDAVARSGRRGSRRLLGESLPTRTSSIRYAMQARRPLAKTSVAEPRPAPPRAYERAASERR